jgi:hypothetical protein
MTSKRTSLSVAQGILGSLLYLLPRYPSVLALSPKKSVFSKMRAQFSKDNVDKFIQNLVRGKEQVAPYRK